MIQSGEILRELLVVLPYTTVKAGTQQLIKKNRKKPAPELSEYATKQIVNKRLVDLKEKVQE